MLHLLQAQTISGVLRYVFRQTGFFLADQVPSMAARAKATCNRCAAKKRRLSANKREKKEALHKEMSKKADYLACENKQFSETFANQQEEIERLRSALAVLGEFQRGSAGVHMQFLKQLHEDASNTTAVSLLLDSRVSDSNRQEAEQAVPDSQDNSGVIQPLQNLEQDLDSRELKHLWHSWQG